MLRDVITNAWAWPRQIVIRVDKIIILDSEITLKMSGDERIFEKIDFYTSIITHHPCSPIYHLIRKLFWILKIEYLPIIRSFYRSEKVSLAQHYGFTIYVCNVNILCFDLGWHSYQNIEIFRFLFTGNSPLWTLNQKGKTFILRKWTAKLSCLWLEVLEQTSTIAITWDIAFGIWMFCIVMLVQ